MFFHRLGPVFLRRLLLTGDIITAADVEHLGVFTEDLRTRLGDRPRRYWAQKAARCRPTAW